MIRCQRILFVFVFALLVLSVASAGAATKSLDPELSAPIVVYNHESIDNNGQSSTASSLDEKQALSDVDQIVRLQKSGMRIDYYLLSASSFAPGGFNALRAQDWPNGPDLWISKCRDAGIRPGLEIGSNTLAAMQSASAVPSQWKDSLSRDRRSLSLFEGGYLPDLMAALQSWYDRGIRLFQLGPIDLGAATPESAARLTADEIVERNSSALRDALLAFHRKNREALLVLLAVPGTNRGTPAPAKAGNDSADGTAAIRADLGDLGAFQLVSTGDPQLTATPQANLARVMDIEGDGRVRRFERLGLPLQHIESAGFTVTASNPRLREPQQAWKGAFLLSMARGGWVNSVHGDLSQIRSVDALWMARAQKLFFTVQEQGRIRGFGGNPGSGRPYGFAAAAKHGSIYVVVNPGYSIASLSLPALELSKPLLLQGHIQFRDAGFMPQLHGDTVTLGPGQMAMIGYGEFAESRFNFGVQQDVVIPNSIEPVDADFQPTAPTTIEARINPPLEGVLRVIVHERPAQSLAMPNGALIAEPEDAANGLVSIQVTQSGRPIPVRLDGDDSTDGELAGSGPLWLVAEIDVNDLTPGMPVRIQFHSDSTGSDDLEGDAYQVVY